VRKEWDLAAVRVIVHSWCMTAQPGLLIAGNCKKEPPAFPVKVPAITKKKHAKAHDRR
tara:strand:- start:199 stop:372 length:174 start_codon:yes stop_codon:yes gene_type:complete